MIDEAVASLSPMQKTCLRLVFEHLQTKEIARQLGLSRFTVETHIKIARARLGTTSRLEAARMLVAIEGNLSPPLQASSPPIAIVTAPDLDPNNEGKTGVMLQSDSLLRPLGSDRMLYQLLPLPKRWGERNDLTSTQRLWQMARITVGICLSLGALVSSLEALRRLL